MEKHTSSSNPGLLMNIAQPVTGEQATSDYQDIL
jgi:hypothetical protein